MSGKPLMHWQCECGRTVALEIDVERGGPPPPVKGVSVWWCRCGHYEEHTDPEALARNVAAHRCPTETRKE